MADAVMTDVEEVKEETIKRIEQLTETDPASKESG